MVKKRGKLKPLVAYNHDGSIVGAIVNGNQMKWWRCDGSKKNKKIKEDILNHQLQEQVTSISFAQISQEQEVVVTGTKTGKVDIYSLDGTKLCTSEALAGIGEVIPVTSLAPLPLNSSREGGIFVCSSAGRSVVEVSLRDGTVRGSFRPAKVGIRRICVTSEHVIVATEDKLKVHSLDDHSVTAKYPIGAMGSNLSGLIAYKDRIIISDGSTISLWDYKTNTSFPIKGTYSEEGNITDLYFSMDGKWFVGRTQSSIYVWSSAKNMDETREHRKIPVTSKLQSIGVVEGEDNTLTIRAVLSNFHSPEFTIFDGLHQAPEVKTEKENEGTQNNETNEKKRPITALGIQATSKKKLKVASELPSDARLQTIIEKREAEWTAERQTIKKGTTSYSATINQWYKTRESSDLESCFRVQKANVINRTVQELQSPVAWQFLIECGNKLMQYPFLVNPLGSWIRQIFRQHAAFILSQNSENKQKLLPLHQYLRQRMTSGPVLQRLQGKIELLTMLAEHKMKKNLKSNNSQEAVIQYQEGDSEKEDDDEMTKEEKEDIDSNEEEEDDELKPEDLALLMQEGGSDMDDDMSDDED